MLEGTVFLLFTIMIILETSLQLFAICCMQFTIHRLDKLKGHCGMPLLSILTRQQVMGKRAIIIGLSVIALFIMPMHGAAQTYEEYRNQQEKEKQQMREERQKAYEQIARERQQYIQRLNAEFEQYLINYWQSFKAFKAREAPDIPGPDQLPSYRNENEKQLPTIPVEPVDQDTSTSQVQLPVLEQVNIPDYPAREQEFSFYGNTISYDVDPAFEANLQGKLSNKVIAEQWQSLNETSYYPLLRRLLANKRRLNLNDWGFYKLVQQAAHDISAGKGNESVMLQWFLLTKANYNTRLAYKNEQLYLLLPFQQTLYKKRYFRINSKRFYLFAGKRDVKDVKTYRKDHPKARKIMTLNRHRSLNFEQKEGSRTVSFRNKEIDVRYNQNVMDFLGSFPLANIEVYFNAPMSETAKASLKAELLPLIEDKSKKEAVSTLLGFVRSFPYQTDREQFDSEKYFFPEEVFPYSHSDCEDRSVLFAWLVRGLLGEKVVGLKYPGHIATAVAMPDTANYSFRYNQDKYLACDPTYEGAPMGRMIPEVENRTATVIEPNNRAHRAGRAETIWAKVNEAGGFRGANDHNIAFTESGHAIVTGYYKGKASFGQQQFTANKEGIDAFAARYNRKNELLWATSLQGSSNDIGSYVHIADDGKSYVAGTFGSELNADGRSIRAQQGKDMFLCRIGANGQVHWLTKAGMDTMRGPQTANFAATFTPNGRQKDTRLYNNASSFENDQINVNGAGDIVITGSLARTAGLRVPRPAGKGRFDPVSALKEKTSKLKEKDYHPLMVGVFAVVDLLRNSGVKLEG